MSLEITLAYAAPGVEEIVVVHLDDGARVADAVRRSGIVPRLQLDPQALEWAIFGQPADLATLLADGDRIELTRPLAAAPMVARHRRADATPAPSKRRQIKPQP